MKSLYEKFKPAIAGAIVDGKNVKRDGKARSWYGTLTGNFRVSLQGEKMVEVIEPGQKDEKWLNLATFSGEIKGKGFSRHFAYNSGEVYPSQDKIRECWTEQSW